MKRMMALICAAVLFWAMPLCAAESEVRELSGYFGADIAETAEALGGLTYVPGEEFADNYDCDAFTLRGNGGVVTVIELKDFPSPDALCGVRVGMTRDEVLALMAGCPMLWEYDEEVAFTVRADDENALNNETLVVFFDDGGRVNGAWYRASGE